MTPNTDDRIEVFRGQCTECGRYKFASAAGLALFDEGFVAPCDCGALFAGGDRENWTSIGEFSEVYVGSL